MRILEIVSAPGVNGVTKHVIDVGLELRDRGHEVSYLCRHQSWVEQVARSHGFDTIVSDMHRWPDDELRKVAGEIRQRGIDVIHTHMSKAHFFGVLLRWYAKVPSVASAHSCHLQLHWMFNDFVIAVSEATRRYHQRINWVSSRRIKTIHNFIKVPDEATKLDSELAKTNVRAMLGLTQDDFVIGLVGRISVQKGQTVMLEAMPSILAQVPTAKLLLIGGFETPDYLAVLQQQIADHHLEHCVQLLGMRSDVLELLRGIDVLAQPSLWESFPISMLEGMAVGVPIVATDVGGVSECLKNDRSGLLVPPNNAKDLAEAIAALAHDPEKRVRLAEEARRVVQFRFTPASQVARIDEVLRSVVRKRVSRAA